MYVYMRVGMCVYVCMHACMCMYVCIYMCVYVCVFVCMYVCMYVLSVFVCSGPGVRERGSGLGLQRELAAGVATTHHFGVQGAQGW